jgi:NhaA family Na+:H+ antiporter
MRVMVSDSMERTETLRPIQRLTRPLLRFLHVESVSGVVLLIFTVAAIVVANSPLAEAYTRFWNTHLTLGAGRFLLSYPLWYWVNDGLMTVFFFLVGLEIKRELVAGELQDFRRMIAPSAAAVGGAIMPALIFLLLQYGQAGQSGWAIPMATDIAFVVGTLALLGKRVPHGLKVFLLTLAIVDDIIAVLVIAIFYSSQIKLVWLAAAAVGTLAVVAMNRLGIRTVAGYIFAGACIWLFTLKSGVHPTISGVVLGLLTPAVPLISRESLRSTLDEAIATIGSGAGRSGSVRLRDVVEKVDFMSREAISPLERFETEVHPWTAFVIMPVFALANAGVTFSFESIASPTATAVAVALLVGKPLGIVLSLLIVVKSGIGIVPGGVSWKAIVGAGCLAGIGFTMSLFVASLSFEGDLLVEAKTGVLAGSAMSALIGLSVLRMSLRHMKPSENVQGSKANRS